jgi:hypothetical protein
MIGAGLLNTSGSRVLYVAMPYVCLFFPVVFNVIGAVVLMSAGSKLEFAAYDKSINRIHKSSIGQLVISGITATGDICYLLFGSHTDQMRREMVFLICMVIVLLISILLLRVRKILNYELEKDLTEE